jgi:hypothetical protein
MGGICKTYGAKSKEWNKGLMRWADKIKGRSVTNNTTHVNE